MTLKTDYELPIIISKCSWWNPKQRELVCPIRVEDFDKVMYQLDKLGCRFLGELAMLVDIGLRFVLVVVPDWLTEDKETSPGYIEFIDSKDITRLRIMNESVWFTTVVFTRYRPGSFIDRKSEPRKVLAVVHDYEKWCAEGGDKENDDEVGAIWTSESSPSLGCFNYLEKADKAAEEWLDKEYPEWRNPVAYWSEVTNVTNISDSGHATGLLSDSA